MYTGHVLQVVNDASYGGPPACPLPPLPPGFGNTNGHAAQSHNTDDDWGAAPFVAVGLRVLSMLCAQSMKLNVKTIRICSKHHLGAPPPPHNGSRLSTTTLDSIRTMM
jgi:hypothetical protein